MKSAVNEFSVPQEQVGYHVSSITRGEYGELSKVREEVEEAVDMEQQGCRIGTLVELSDLIGAVRGYLERHHPETTLEDLVSMANLTRRAFENGHRKQK